jgi:hypothetical protein
MIAAALTTHKLAAIAIAILFLFQMAMLEVSMRT